MPVAKSFGRGMLKGAAGIGGALGAATIATGGALARTAGMTPLIAAGALGIAGARKGISMLPSASAEDADKLEQEQKQVTYGAANLEILNEIHQQTTEIKNILSDRDPKSVQEEEARDRKEKHKELLAAFMAIGTGDGEGEKPNKGWVDG